MASLVIDCYIDLPILDVLDDGQPIFHRVILPSHATGIDPTTPTKDAPTSATTTTPPESEPESKPPTEVGPALIITNATKIHASEHTSVYRASLDLDDDHDGQLVDVVLKLSKDGPRIDAFLSEYKSYSELEKYQGVIIPRCYGLFQAIVAAEESEDPENADVVSCLVLSDSGGPSAPELNKNSREFNLSIIKAIETLHDAGYTHGSIQPSNILEKQGAAVLIDLEFTREGHKCGRTATVSANGLEYKSGDFGCPEIYNAARKMDLWKKSGLHYFF